MKLPSIFIKIRFFYHVNITAYHYKKGDFDLHQNHLYYQTFCYYFYGIYYFTVKAYLGVGFNGQKYSYSPASNSTTLVNELLPSATGAVT